MVNAGLSECKACVAWTPGGSISWLGPPGCAYSGPLLNGLWAALIATPPGAKRAGKEPTNGLAWQRVRGPREKKSFVLRPLKTGRSWPPGHAAFLFTLYKSKRVFSSCQDLIEARGDPVVAPSRAQLPCLTSF